MPITCPILGRDKLYEDQFLLKGIVFQKNYNAIEAFLYLEIFQENHINTSLDFLESIADEAFLTYEIDFLHSDHSISS